MYDIRVLIDRSIDRPISMYSLDFLNDDNDIHNAPHLNNCRTRKNTYRTPNFKNQKWLDSFAFFLLFTLEMCAYFVSFVLLHTQRQIENWIPQCFTNVSCTQWQKIQPHSKPDFFYSFTREFIYRKLKRLSKFSWAKNNFQQQIFKVVDAFAIQTCPNDLTKRIKLRYCIEFEIRTHLTGWSHWWQCCFESGKFQKKKNTTPYVIVLKSCISVFEAFHEE